MNGKFPALQILLALRIFTIFLAFLHPNVGSWDFTSLKNNSGLFMKAYSKVYDVEELSELLKSIYCKTLIKNFLS